MTLNRGVENALEREVISSKDGEGSPKGFRVVQGHESVGAIDDEDVRIFTGRYEDVSQDVLSGLVIAIRIGNIHYLLVVASKIGIPDVNLTIEVARYSKGDDAASDARCRRRWLRNRLRFGFWLRWGCLWLWLFAGLWHHLMMRITITSATATSSDVEAEHRNKEDGEICLLKRKEMFEGTKTSRKRASVDAETSSQ